MDRFHRRLLWPIRSSAGEVIGFGARRLFDDDPMEAKYVNTPETVLYKKSNVLFGLDLAKRDIAKGHQAVVVEGYTDVMAMHLAGRDDGGGILRHRVRRRAPVDAAPTHDGRQLLSR